MKKIIFYTMGMTYGGTERVIANLANYFCNKYDITIVTNHKLESKYKLDSKIKYLNIDSVNKLNEKFIKKLFTKISSKRTKKLKEIINKIKPDIVISFLPEPSMRLMKIKKYFKNTKFMIAIRNHPQKEFPFTKFIRNHYYKYADKIILQTKSFQNYLPQYLENKIIVIPNYIKLDFNKKVSKRRKDIVTVGRFNKQKNQILLINAFSKLASKYNDYTLNIYGTGKLKEELKKLVTKLNLNDKVFINNNVKDVYSKIYDASLFVLPSNYEGMPNALLEALALGLPCISTNCCDVINDIIENNGNGLIIEKNNIMELVSAMDKILASKTLKKKLSTNAKKISNLYNKENILQLWDNLFKIK